jgi:hypothetical protein
MSGQAALGAGIPGTESDTFGCAKGLSKPQIHAGKGLSWSLQLGALWEAPLLCTWLPYLLAHRHFFSQNVIASK